MDASQSREEFKFLLPRDLAEHVRDAVAARLPADRGLEEGYGIESDYFDTPDHETLWQKRIEHPNRRRIRSRVYHSSVTGEPPQGFIEIKHKLVGTTVKRRLPVPSTFLADRDPFAPLVLPPAFMPAATQPSEHRAWREVQELLGRGFNRPAVRLTFRRLAYDAGALGHLRITFDRDLHFASLAPGAPLEPHPLFADENWIMEVKAVGAVPYWFRQLVARHRLIPRGVSKYVLALEHEVTPQLALT